MIFYRKKLYYEIKTDLIKDHKRETLFFAAAVMRNLIDTIFEEILLVDVDRVLRKRTFLSYHKFL